MKYIGKLIRMFIINRPIGYSVRPWPGRPEFNPRLNHTKDSKISIWYLLG